MIAAYYSQKKAIAIKQRKVKLKSAQFSTRTDDDKKSS